MSVPRLVVKLLEVFETIDQLVAADADSIASIDGLGTVIANSLRSYFAKEEATELLHELEKCRCQLCLSW